MEWTLVISRIFGENRELEDFVNGFRRCVSDVERVDSCRRNEHVMNMIQSWISGFQRNAFSKSAVLSLKHREEGNVHFQQKEYEQALKHYTKSILCAPCEESGGIGDHLAVGFANRSAAFYHKEEFQACLDDIDRSFAANYPSHLNYKLLVRKAHCLFRLCSYSEGASVAKLALESLDGDASLTAKRKDEFQCEMSDILKKCASAERRLSTLCDSSERLPAIKNGEHAVVKSMSSALSVKYSRDKGRHIVVSQEIKAGDAIFVEKPFASVLLPQFYDSHCHHCHGRMVTPIPCKFCSHVSYCSVPCQQLSWKIYHRIECGLLELLHVTGLAHLVFRIILVAGLPFVLRHKEYLKEKNETDNSVDIMGISDNVPYEGYFAVHSLVTNSKRVKEEDLLAYTVTAVMLSELLKSELKLCRATEDDVSFVSILMLRHTNQLICNAHAVTELWCTESDAVSLVLDEILERIATAIYPCVSLANHACEPTVISSFHKNMIIVRSVTDMLSGEEVYNCYGPHFKRMSQSERKSVLLEQYFFDCCCKHCISDEHGETKSCKFRCISCEGPLNSSGLCEDCGKIQDCSQAIKEHCRSLQLYESAVQYMLNKKHEDALKCAHECLNLQTRFMYKFDKHLGETYDTIARIYAEKDNFSRSTEYLQLSMAVTKHIYGAESVELANEIQKFTDVALKAIFEGQIDNEEKAKQLVDDVYEKLNCGIQIFLIHYGASHSSTREMVSKSKHVESFRASVNKYN